MRLARSPGADSSLGRAGGDFRSTTAPYTPPSELYSEYGLLPDIVSCVLLDLLICFIYELDAPASSGMIKLI